jgi:hypothetical protein
LNDFTLEHKFMRVVELPKLNAEEWDRVVDQSIQGWLFHRSDWLALEEEFFVQRNLSFGIDEKGKLLAIHPLYLSDPGTGTRGELLLHSGIHRHAALAHVPGLDVSAVKSLRTVAMRHIDGMARELNVDRIQFGIQNLAPESLGPGRVEIPFWVTDYHFLLGVHYNQTGALPVPGMVTLAVDQIVDIRHSPEVLFARLDDACRRAVRKAEANGLRCVQRELDEAIDDYYELAQHRAQQTKQGLPPRNFYLALARRLGRQRIRLFLAEQNGKLAAGLILLADKGALSFFASASHQDCLQFRVNDFIHWSAIQWGAMNGFHSYRLGPWFPEVPDDWAIAKVSKFKTKFGGRQISSVQASFYRHPQQYLQAGIAALSQYVGELATRESFFASKQ